MYSLFLSPIDFKTILRVLLLVNYDSNSQGHGFGLKLKICGAIIRRLRIWQEAIWRSLPGETTPTLREYIEHWETANTHFLRPRPSKENAFRGRCYSFGSSRYYRVNLRIVLDETDCGVPLAFCICIVFKLISGSWWQGPWSKRMNVHSIRNLWEKNTYQPQLQLP